MIKPASILEAAEDDLLEVRLPAGELCLVRVVAVDHSDDGIVTFRTEPAEAKYRREDEARTA